MTHLVTTTNRQAVPELSQHPHTVVPPMFLSSASPLQIPQSFPGLAPLLDMTCLIIVDSGIPQCAVAHTENVNPISRLSRGVVSLMRG